MTQKRSAFVLTMLAFGYAFLYLPIIALVIFSFNESERVTTWTRFSTKWYGELLRNEQILNAAWLSLQIAVMTATGAVILGTLAAFVLTRFQTFAGRTLLGGLVTAPLVMPEVITGLSMLLLFIALDMTRGITTVTIAHITFALSYVTVVVRSRLVSMDLSVEEAALDLGARPWKVFFVITLPIIAPALVSGWLLAFTLSLDDLVISQFVNGPGSSTLPMVVFSKVRLKLSPDINALATIFVTVIATGMIVSALWQGRVEQKRKDDERLAFGGDQ